MSRNRCKCAELRERTREAGGEKDDADDGGAMQEQSKVRTTLVAGKGPELGPGSRKFCSEGVLFVMQIHREKQGRSVV